MMDRKEMYDRYYRAHREAESEMQCWIHAMSTEADVFDRLQLAMLWRSFIEGNPVTESTFAMMLEATNV